MKTTETDRSLPTHYYWVLQCLGWGIYATIGFSIQGLYGGFSSRVVGLALSGSLILLLLTHLLRHISKRNHWTSLTFGRLALRIFVSTLLMAIVSQLLVSVLMIWVFDLLGNQTYSFVVLGIYIFQTQVILICWSLIYFSFHAVRNRQHEQVEKWRLQAALKDAELAALKAQINPHFMFNCLNNIRALVLEDPERSREMITRLSDLLRYCIRLNQEPLVSLGEEMEIVADYLMLESIHYEERLSYELQMSEDLLGIKVPPMSIQLLVENAVKHGISKLPRGGKIRVETQKQQNQLTIVVTNSGQLAPTSENSPTGSIGLQNARERLALLFPNDGRLFIRNRDAETVEAGFSFTIS